MPTENHGYNTPAEGTEDWHLPVNENFENIDTDVLIRDTEANLGNYTPTAGAAFLATDTLAFYEGNGTDWLIRGYLSPVQVTVSDTEPLSHEAGDIWIQPQ